MFEKSNILLETILLVNNLSQPNLWLEKWFIASDVATMQEIDGPLQDCFSFVCYIYNAYILSQGDLQSMRYVIQFQRTQFMRRLIHEILFHQRLSAVAIV